MLPDGSPYGHATTTIFSYDALNRKTRALEAEGTGDQRQTDFQYDAADNVLKVIRFSNTDDRRIVTSYAYDPLNRRTRTIEAFQAVENGWLESLFGKSPERRADMVYDAADNLMTVTTGLAGDPVYAKLSRSKF